MQKHILTQEDLDANPELAEQGLEVGDEVDFPSFKENEDGQPDDESDPLPPKNPPTHPPLNEG